MPDGHEETQEVVILGTVRVPKVQSVAGAREDIATSPCRSISPAFTGGIRY